MSTSHSVSQLLRRLDEDESEVARQLWDRYIHRLISAARRHLRNLPRRVVDEEDVAISAFDAFFRGVGQQRFGRLENRDDLWQVLAMLAERKAIAVLRRELADKRGGGLNRGDSVFDFGVDSSAAGMDQVADTDPRAVELFTMETRELLERLDDPLLNRIAILRLEGCTTAEISQQLDVSKRSVERKLGLIRQKWQAES